MPRAHWRPPVRIPERGFCEVWPNHSNFAVAPPLP